MLSAILEDPRPETPAKGPGKGRGVRRAQQRYFPSLLAYFTHSEWQTLLGQGVPISVRMSLTHWRITMLGGQNLTEPCKQYIAALCMYLCAGAGALGVPPSVRSSVQRDVKAAWEKWARRNDVSKKDYLPFLPGSPEVLEAERPTLFSRVFSHDKPELNRIDLRIVDSIDRLMNCRGEFYGGLACDLSPIANLGAQMQQLQEPQPKCLQDLFSQSPAPMVQMVQPRKHQASQQSQRQTPLDEISLQQQQQAPLVEFSQLPQHQAPLVGLPQQPQSQASQQAQHQTPHAG